MPSDKNAFVLQNLSLELPDGRLLVERIDAEFVTGDSVLIHGPSGKGKSTASGDRGHLAVRQRNDDTRGMGGPVRAPEPYLRLETLRAASYPRSPQRRRQHIRREACGLRVAVSGGTPRRNAKWGLELSGGEHQRIAFCVRCSSGRVAVRTNRRAGSTSIRSAATALRRDLAGTAIISVGHRPSSRAITLGDSSSIRRVQRRPINRERLTQSMTDRKRPRRHRNQAHQPPDRRAPADTEQCRSACADNRHHQ